MAEVGVVDMQEQIDLLKAVYYDTPIEVTAFDSPASLLPCRITLTLTPRCAGQRAFLSPRVSFAVPARYPEEHVGLTVVHANGLDQDGIAEITQQLQLLQLQQVDEPSLLLVVEAALAWLTENNRPRSVCIVCLCDFSADQVSSPDATALLPCWHCFHVRCFARHWQFQRAKHAAALLDDRADGRRRPDAAPRPFLLPCPLCRAPADPAAEEVASAKAILDELEASSPVTYVSSSEDEPEPGPEQPEAIDAVVIVSHAHAASAPVSAQVSGVSITFAASSAGVASAPTAGSASRPRHRPRRRPGRGGQHAGAGAPRTAAADSEQKTRVDCDQERKLVQRPRGPRRGKGSRGRGKPSGCALANPPT